MKLTRQNLEDLLSAISFFQRAYPDRKKNPQTMKAMERLSKKLWREVKKKP